MELRFFINTNTFKAKSNKAFTLAEVLITLGIIGIVAAITIPILVSSYQEKVFVTQFQKVYSQLSQAYNMAAKDNGTADTWSSSQDAYNYLKPYFNINEDCPNVVGCFPQVSYNDLKGSPAENPYNRVRYKFNLTNGVSMMFDGTVGIFVDTNGKNGPNQFGYDFFYLILNNKNGAPYISGITPGMDIPGFCKKIGTPTGGWYNGGSCACWLIRHGNLDYLQRDISAAEWSQ